MGCADPPRIEGGSVHPINCSQVHKKRSGCVIDESSDVPTVFRNLRKFHFNKV